MKRTFFISILLAGFALNAKTAPGYDSLRKMDSAIATLAKGGGKTGLATKKPGDVMVAGARSTENKTTGAEIISVDIGGHICALKMTKHNPPKGMSGSASFTAAVISCTRYVNAKAPELMKYEDARLALADYASKGKVNLSFRVLPSPQGPKVVFQN